MKKTLTSSSDSQSICNISKTLIKKLLSNRKRMFRMFHLWQNDWICSGENIYFIEEIVDIFMNKRMFYEFSDNVIKFMETRDKTFYINLNDIQHLTGEEEWLIIECNKINDLLKTYNTKIQFKRIDFDDDTEIKGLREKLCEWYIFFDISNTVEYTHNIIECEEIFGMYIKCFERLCNKFQLNFIKNLTISMKKSVH